MKRIDFEAGLIHENITAIYFDGRKDETLKRTQNDSCVKYFGKSVKEHITVLTKPWHNYLTHFGCAKDIPYPLLSILADNDFNAAVNTGIEHGVIS